MAKTYKFDENFGEIGGELTQRMDAKPSHKNLVGLATKNRVITNRGFNAKRPGTVIIDKLDTFTDDRLFTWYVDDNNVLAILLYKKTSSQGFIIYDITTEGRKLQETDSTDNEPKISKFATESIRTMDFNKIQFHVENDRFYFSSGESLPLQFNRKSDGTFTLSIWGNNKGKPPFVRSMIDDNTIDKTAQKVFVDTGIFADLATAKKYVVEIPKDIEAKAAEGETEAVEAVTYEKTARLVETETAPYWELQVVDADPDEFAMSGGIYIFDWYSPPNTTTAFANSLTFAGSKLQPSTVWQSVPNNYNTFQNYVKNQEEIAFTNVYTLKTSLEIVASTSVEDFLVLFTAEDTIFVDHANNARVQSGHGLKPKTKPVIFDRDIYAINSRNELVLWRWTGDINGGWQVFNVSGLKDIDNLVGGVENMETFRYVFNSSAKQNNRLERNIQLNVDCVALKTNANELIVFHPIDDDVLQGGRWEIDNSFMQSVTSDYSNLYATINYANDRYLVKFDERETEDLVGRDNANTPAELLLSITSNAEVAADLPPGEYANYSLNKFPDNHGLVYTGTFRNLFTDVPVLRVKGKADEAPVEIREDDNDANSKLIGYTGFGTTTDEFLANYLWLSRVNEFELGIEDGSLITYNYGHRARQSFLRGEGHANYKKRMKQDFYYATVFNGGLLQMSHTTTEWVPTRVVFKDGYWTMYATSEYDYSFNLLLYREGNNLNAVGPGWQGTNNQVFSQSYNTVFKDANFGLWAKNIEKLYVTKINNFKVGELNNLMQILPEPFLNPLPATAAAYTTDYLTKLDDNRFRQSDDNLILSLPTVQSVNFVLEKVAPTPATLGRRGTSQRGKSYSVADIIIDCIHVDNTADIFYKERKISKVKQLGTDKDSYFSGEKRIPRTFTFHADVGTDRFYREPYFNIVHNTPGQCVVLGYRADMIVYDQ